MNSELQEAIRDVCTRAAAGEARWFGVIRYEDGTVEIHSGVSITVPNPADVPPYIVAYETRAEEWDSLDPVDLDSAIDSEIELARDEIRELLRK